MKNQQKNNLNQLLQVKNIFENSADLHIYGDIVCDSWSKWQDEDKYPMEIKNFLDEVKGKDLNIYINSGGGSVFAGMAIYNMLKRHEGNKTVYVDGLAGSISSVIALAGDKVVIPSNAYFMIHKPLCCVCGNANDFQEYIDILNKIEDGIINVYMENVQEGVNEKTIRNLVNSETWMTGNEASKYFNIEVSEELQAVAFVGDVVNTFKNKPQIEVQNSDAEDEKLKNEKNKCSTKLRLLGLKGAKE